MPDLLQSGASWLAGQLATHAAQPASFTSGGVSVPVRVTLGRRRVEVFADNGARIVSQVVTATLPALDLQGVVPVPGATLTLGGRRLELGHPEPGQPAWEWADSHLQSVRLYLRESHEAQPAG